MSLCKIKLLLNRDSSFIYEAFCQIFELPLISSIKHLTRGFFSSKYKEEEVRDDQK